MGPKERKKKLPQCLQRLKMNKHWEANTENKSRNFNQDSKNLMKNCASKGKTVLKQKRIDHYCPGTLKILDKSWKMQEIILQLKLNWTRRGKLNWLSSKQSLKNPTSLTKALLLHLDKNITTTCLKWENRSTLLTK